MQSIRLSQLNPDVREKVRKFDTLNDGELSLDEAIQGLIAIQKQSNNYKRMVYILIPTLIFTLAAVLGLNILSIYLTKDMKVTTDFSRETNNPVLIDNQGKTVQTQPIEIRSDFISILSNYDVSALYSITNLEMDGLNVPVQGIFVSGLENTTTTVMISTPYVWFSVDSDGKFNIDYHLWVNPNDTFAQIVFHSISTNLQNLINSVFNPITKIQGDLKNSNHITFKPKQQEKEVKVIIKSDVKPTPRGIGGFGCGKRACFG